jgi:hypothetical protein
MLFSWNMGMTHLVMDNFSAHEKTLKNYSSKTRRRIRGYVSSHHIVLSKILPSLAMEKGSIWTKYSSLYLEVIFLI